MINQDSVLSNGSDCSGKSIVISAKHYDCLLNELKCPGCASPLSKPIKLCKTGHSLCSYCAATSKSCPICFGRISDMRSLTLEALVAKAQFSCSNSKHGCTVRMPVDLMKWHKKRCLFNLGACFMGKVWGICDWSGREANWIQHCDDKHADKIFKEDEVVLKTSFDRINNTNEPVIGFFIFKIYGELFNLYQVYDKKHMFMLWTLICTSKEANISKLFCYEIELFSPGEISRLILQRNFCLAENDEDMLKDGRCISFHLSDLMKYVNMNKEIHYRFRVKVAADLNQSPVNTNVKLRSKQSENSNRQNCHSVDVQQLIKFPQENIPQPVTPTLISKTSGEDDLPNVSEISNISKMDQNAVNQKRKMFQQTMMKKNVSLDENDSIDKEIAENIDLKKVMIKEFTIDKNSDEIVVKTPNVVPKPPRQISVNSSSNNDESILKSTSEEDKLLP